MTGEQVPPQDAKARKLLPGEDNPGVAKKERGMRHRWIGISLLAVSLPAMAAESIEERYRKGIAAAKEDYEKSIAMNSTAVNGLARALQMVRSQIKENSCSGLGIEEFRTALSPGIDAALWHLKRVQEVIPANAAFELRQYRSMMVKVAEAVLEAGETALESECLDFADSQYRFVLRTMTEEAFAAHRQRALVGIEDVRGARSRTRQ